MKRILSILLTGSILISLAACATYTPPDTPPEEDPPASDLTVQEPPEEETPPSSEDTPDQTPEGEGSEQPGETETPPSDSETDLPEGSDDPQEGDQPSEDEEYVRVIDPSRPMVALTFDDGPHEQYSQQILDVLEANHSVATFFEVGYNAVRYPEILRRIVELDCELASHSYYHYDLTTLSKDAMLTDLAKLDKVIYEATGITPTLVRPPYGAVNSTVKYTSGRAMILWTVDTRDWMYRDAQVLIDYIQNYGDLDGEIVLMHSIHGSTAEAMETVIPWLIEQGYQLVTVSELMAYYYGELLEANHYYNQTYFAKHDRTEFPIELPEEPMKTDIPEFTVVPIVPITPPSDTPDTPSDGTETPPEGTETPPEGTETPPEGDETSPPEEEPSLPPEDPVIPPDDESTDDTPNEGEEDIPDEESPPESGEDDTPSDEGSIE